MSIIADCVATCDQGVTNEDSHPPRRRRPTLSPWAAESILSPWADRASAMSAASRAASFTRSACSASTAIKASSCTGSIGTRPCAPAGAPQTARGARGAASLRCRRRIRIWIGRTLRRGSPDYASRANIWPRLDRGFHFTIGFSSRCHEAYPPARDKAVASQNMGHGSMDGAY